MDGLRLDIGERAWVTKGYVFGVTGVGVVGVGGGAGEAGRESRLCSEYILVVMCRKGPSSLEALNYFV